MTRFAVCALLLFVSAPLSACDDANGGEDAKQNGSTAERAQAASASAGIVDCSAAIVDRVDPRWRSRSIVRGSFGLYANAADIRTADRWGRAAFWTKVPAILAHHRPATLRVSARDRDRIGLTYGPSVPSPATSNHGARGLAAAPREVRFEPCRDRARTAWPGGFALADREPVHLRVHLGGQGWRSLSIPPRG